MYVHFSYIPLYNGGCDQICINTIPAHWCYCDVYILLIMTISLVCNANCSEGACVCLDGFVDYRGSGDYSIAVAVVTL